MDELKELSSFEECLSWIDAIVTLCKSIDNTCSKLDHNFPSEYNLNGLCSYMRIHNDDSAVTSNTSSIDEGYNTEYEESVREHLRSIINDLKNKNNPQLVYSYGTGLIGQKMEEPGVIRRTEYPQMNRDRPYKLTIRGRSRKDMNSIDFHRTYQMESEILKRLNVGERICIFRVSSSLYDMEVEKNTAEYDFLLDMPFMIKPDTNMKEAHYRSDVAGVYWDKRSWIASWYVEGKRQYKSFSCKLYGFYRSKYLAIQTRLSNIYPIDFKALKRH
ncbi:conserved hypothetical protein [Theileria orientalis strain Shintoku]|uniref:AP2/ERF domain-containing protein n=1 Tax=Theileria orientalis strain Shintoku TaxID=869250 RepID=J4D6B1_THEOR|nr:conserved hypothetical protein [Theileria orientalis strain Shintoku]BAM39465.1 conserved hypothetical protein [Theileria orientalis strain Shintoku]|eukprot:XP_009689766.1 conserved hypothetical protein [Theileria orientalis strain Shintoku]